MTVRRARWGETGPTFEVLITQPPTDECIDSWPFARTPAGYPVAWVNKRVQLLSRVVCDRHYGPPPTPRHEAAHRCGNSGCLNPLHIRWATRTENEADKAIHGTRTFPHKFSRAIADEIRGRYAAGGITMQQLGDDFGMSIANVHGIVHNKRWAS